MRACQASKLIAEKNICNRLCLMLTSKESAEKV